MLKLSQIWPGAAHSCWLLCPCNIPSSLSSFLLSGTAGYYRLSFCIKPVLSLESDISPRTPGFVQWEKVSENEIQVCSLLLQDLCLLVLLVYRAKKYIRVYIHVHTHIHIHVFIIYIHTDMNKYMHIYIHILEIIIHTNISNSSNLFSRFFLVFSHLILV